MSKENSGIEGQLKDFKEKEVNEKLWAVREEEKGKLHDATKESKALFEENIELWRMMREF